jgi:hypothetical protein
MVPKKGALRIDRMAATAKFSLLAFFVLTQTGTRVTGAPNQHISDMEISIELRNVLLRDALTRIGDAAHLTFVYVSNKVLDKNKVTITVHRQKVGKVLDRLLHPYSLNYTVLDNRVVVWPDAGRQLHGAAITGKAPGITTIGTNK